MLSANTLENQRIDQAIEHNIMDKEDEFAELKAKKLNNLLTKTARKGKKAQQQDMVGSALEKAQVQYCKVNTLQELYPETTKIYPSPLIEQENAPDHTFSLPNESFVEPNTFII
mmetsp:Transcript_35649/g.54541  ORF Transcript_35649/g.54541 Transcript_35649/m.54541 type:complete len:114 (+) Transcript_35649:142-483(+)